MSVTDVHRASRRPAHRSEPAHPLWGKRRAGRRLSAGWFGLLCALCFLLGCARTRFELAEVRHHFYQGDMQSAADALDRQLEQGKSPNQDVLPLESAMVQLVSGEPAAAEATLRAARDRLDHLEQFSLGEQVASTLTDDQRRAFTGSAYERVMVRAMLALANLLDDGEDAYAYSLQIGEKQAELLAASNSDSNTNTSPNGQADPEAGGPAHQQLAFGAYLQGMIREETHRDYDGAARAWARVVAWEPSFQAGPQYLERARHGRHSTAGHGVVYVFALVGRGPRKVEVAEVPTSAALLLADQILTNSSEYRLPPTVAPVKVPRVLPGEALIDRVQVLQGNRPLAQTDSIAQVSRLAIQDHQANHDRILARAITRRVIKKGTVAVGRKMAGEDDAVWLNLLFDGLGVAWEASESADTRCWSLLPHQIQVARLELPTGRHALSLLPIRDSQGCGTPAPFEVTIHDGRNAYVLACFPDTELVGKVLVR